MTKPLWETTYAEMEAKSFGDVSQEIFDLIPMLPSRAKILDLGCGDGRNALPLARAGFDVTAIDLSQVGIHKLNTLAERENLSIQTAVADMTTFKIPRDYDLIISQGCLHFVERRHWEQLIQDFKDHTKLHGFNAITVFTNEIPPPPELTDLCVGMFPEGELYTMYSEWDILLAKSYTFQDDHAGGIQHLHAANKLIARNIQMN